MEYLPDIDDLEYILETFQAKSYLKLFGFEVPTQIISDNNIDGWTVGEANELLSRKHSWLNQYQIGLDLGRYTASQIAEKLNVSPVEVFRVFKTKSVSYYKVYGVGYVDSVDLDVISSYLGGRNESLSSVVVSECSVTDKTQANSEDCTEEYPDENESGEAFIWAAEFSPNELIGLAHCILAIAEKAINEGTPLKDVLRMERFLDLEE